MVARLFSSMKETPKSKKAWVFFLCCNNFLVCEKKTQAMKARIFSSHLWKKNPSHECPRLLFFVEKRWSVHHPAFFIHEKDTWVGSKKAQVFFCFLWKRHRTLRRLEFFVVLCNKLECLLHDSSLPWKRHRGHERPKFFFWCFKHPNYYWLLLFMKYTCGQWRPGIFFSL